MFRKKQSLGLRLWHWSNFVIIISLFATVVLRKTFLSVKENSVVILKKAEEFGAVLTDKQAIEIARALRNQMWQWHPIIGFIAIGLLVFRIIVYFQNKPILANLPKKPLYYRVVKKGHLLFYFLLGIMGITGSLMYWDESLNLGHGINDLFKEIHENLLWFFVVFVVAHILGVVKAEQGEDRGLISDMFNGGKD